MIELQNVKVEFDSTVVLDNVNLSIPQGDSLVLIGPSGAGKSVLLKVMAGLIEPSEGIVSIGGRELSTLRGAERVNLLRKMGMLFQKNALFDSLTVAENVAFPMRETTDKTEDEISKTITYFLDAVGILHAKDLFPDEISGGMQKRLGIARALALYPDIIMYDDPTAGLDPITSRTIIDLILNLQKETGSTIVSVTNEMNRAYQLAGQIAMVVDNTVVLTGDRLETEKHGDPRVQQFIQGQLQGPLTALA